MVWLNTPSKSKWATSGLEEKISLMLVFDAQHALTKSQITDPNIKKNFTP
jgi:hypothetical protein